MVSVSRTMALHVHYKTQLYISQPFSARQQREITTFYVKNASPDGKFFMFLLRDSQGVLVPLFPSKIALCSHVPTLSQNVFVLLFFEFCSPVPKNWLMFPCFLRYFANVPLFPKTPGRPSLLENHACLHILSLKKF